MIQRRRFLNALLGLGLIPAAALTVSACRSEVKKGRPVAKGAVVLAFGDSLTEGYGASSQASYPTMLASMTGWRVVNGGVSGDTTADALKRLPALLQQHKPELVLTCIGGNDMLKRLSVTKMRSNITQICEHIKAHGAQNMLIAVPELSLLGAVTGRLKDHPAYQELSKQLDLPLQEEAWSEVLSDERLKSDAIHGNEKGYARFTELLVKSLRQSNFLY